MFDTRFAKLKHDPRFRRSQKKKSKDIIDERFKSDFANDHRGKREHHPAFIRGEDLVESSEELEDDPDEQVQNAAKLDSEVEAFEDDEPSTNLTDRLAVVNLDWDHVKACDLFRIFASILSQENTSFSSQAVIAVRIYPSEFGKECLKLEERKGPPTEIFKNHSEIEEQSNSVQIRSAADYDEDSLRKYQLDRLRYYYAIATFSSKEACAYAYNELNGTELEKSANVLDLTYVPFGMQFDDETHDECLVENLPTAYKCLDFATDALRHSRVKLTWEDDDPNRAKITRRKLSQKELESTDFRAYVASSGSDSDSCQADSDSRQRLRCLLLDNPDPDAEVWNSKAGRAQNVDVTFIPGVTAGDNIEIEEEGENTLEKYKRRQREKRARWKANSMREKMHLKNSKQPFDASHLTAGTGIESFQHFDLASILRHEKLTSSRKRNMRKRKAVVDATELGLQDAFVMDANDSRFSAIHTDHHYAVDPSNSQFRGTKNMVNLLKSKLSDVKPEDEGKQKKKKSKNTVNIV